MTDRALNPDDVRIVAEDADCNIVPDDQAAHFAVFPSGQDWDLLGTFPTRSAAEAWVKAAVQS